jgi:hypothetical protein
MEFRQIPGRFDHFLVMGIGPHDNWDPCLCAVGLSCAADVPGMVTRSAGCDPLRMKIEIVQTNQSVVKTTAPLDRLLHTCHVVNLECRLNRLRDLKPRMRWVGPGVSACIFGIDRGSQNDSNEFRITGLPTDLRGLGPGKRWFIAAQGGLLAAKRALQQFLRQDR